MVLRGFSAGSNDKKKIPYECRRHRLDPWVGKIPWRRKWQLTLVFLSGKSQWQWSLVGGAGGYSPWSHKESDRTEQLSDSSTVVLTRPVDSSWHRRVRLGGGGGAGRAGNWGG